MLTKLIPVFSRIGDKTGPDFQKIVEDDAHEFENRKEMTVGCFSRKLIHKM